MSVFTGCQVESDDSSNEPAAKNSYTITFNANGGSGEMKAQTAEKGTEITLTTNAFTREGFTFSGWATSADGNIVHMDGAKIKLTENLTLYAQWTEIGKVEKVAFSVTGDVDYNEKISLSCGTDGATIYYAVVVGTDAPTAEEFSSSKQKYSEPLAITENAVIAAVAVKKGMKDSEIATATFTVKTYTVTFKTEHGTAPAKIEGLKKGGKIGDRLQELTAEGYKFDGWFNGETRFTTETEITSNLTLTAKWTKTYTITFDANGGNGEMNPQTAESGTEITLSENTFTKDGNIFAGWATSADGDVSYSDKAKITVTGNITLYAKWVVTAANISEAIKNIPADGKVHTVVLVGEISEDTITAIRSALYENSDAKINLDMSDTTGLTKIPDCAFFDVDKSAGCKALAGIVLPKGIESIGDGAFAGSSLPSITFGSGLESIGGRAFSWCDSLTEITIPGNVKIIEITAFAVCPNLEKAVLEEGVQTIRELAFGDCEKLASVTIPKSVTSIEDSAFFSCDALQTVNYGGTVAEWNALKDDGKISSTGNDELLDAAVYCADGSLNTDAVSVINRLGEGEHTVTVTGEISEEYLAEIVNAAINNNGNIIRITLDLSGTTGLTEIPEGIFKSQGFLVEIMLPQSVTKIGKEAFSYSDLSKITIPDSVTEIEEGAFEECAKLKSVKIGSKVAEIGAYAFMNCIGLTSIEIPDSVISVDNQIFSYCSALKNVTLGKGITSISTNMFSGCSALEKIEIPDGVKSIEDCAFDMCEKLESIIIPKSVTSIVSYAFDYCTSLADVYYGGTVAEWNALKDSGKISDTGNDALFNATIHCTDGDITPTTGE